MALSTTGGRVLKQITVEGRSGIDCGVASILNHLKSHSTICSLLLCEISTGSLDEAVSALLLCEAVQIETLMLRKCYITEDIWIRLRSALKSNVAVTKLELKTCLFDEKATADFMSSAGSLVSSLCFPRDMCYPYSNGSVFGTLGLNYVYFMLLTVCKNPLKNLQILDASDTEALFQCLQTYDIQVGSLTLDLFDGCTALEELLPRLTKLRILTFGSLYRQHRTASLLGPLRLNGSLWEFGEGDGWPWSKSEEKKVKAFGLRNRHVPELLAHAKNDETLKLLVPHLFCVAQQSPRMAPNMILLGLLAGSSTIGSSSKRCRAKAELKMSTL
jgi:hypothetical protein